MKHLLLTTIAAVLVVGCATTQSPEPPTAKALDISIHEASKKGNLEAVKQHLAAGSDVNAKSYDEWTPLHFAASKGHKEIVELLIAKGPDVNAKDDWGKTPLHYAANHGHKVIVEPLIANGADVNPKDEDGETPLDWAILAKHTKTADLLRKHGGKTGAELKAEGK